MDTTHFHLHFIAINIGIGNIYLRSLPRLQVDCATFFNVSKKIVEFCWMVSNFSKYFQMLSNFDRFCQNYAKNAILLFFKKISTTSLNVWHLNTDFPVNEIVFKIIGYASHFLLLTHYKQKYLGHRMRMDHLYLVLISFCMFLWEPKQH